MSQFPFEQIPTGGLAAAGVPAPPVPDRFAHAGRTPRLQLRGWFVEGSGEGSGSARPSTDVPPDVPRREQPAPPPPPSEGFVTAFDEARRKHQGQGVPFLVVALRADDTRLVEHLPPLVALLRAVLSTDVPMVAAPSGLRLAALLPEANELLAPELLRRLRRLVDGLAPRDEVGLADHVRVLVMPQGEPFVHAGALLRYVLESE